MSARSVSAYCLTLGLLIVVGRWSVLPATGLALFWPASGVSVAWMLRVRGRRAVQIASAGIFVVLSVGNIATGVPVAAGIVLGAANLALALAAWWVVRALRARRKLADDTSGAVEPTSVLNRIRNRADYVEVLCGIAAGAVVSSAVGVLASVLRGREVTWMIVLAWIVRNGVGAVAVGGFLLTIPRRRPGRSLPDRWRRVVGPRPLELLSLLAATAAVESLVLKGQAYLPLAFLPLVLVTWVGVRFRPPFAAGYVLLLAAVTVADVQLSGGGPFGAVPDPTARAILIQSFVALAAVLALLLSLGVAEQRSLASQLRESVALARRRAEELQAVMHTVPDGLLVADRDGRAVLSNARFAQLLDGPDEATDRMPEPAGLSLTALDGSALDPADWPVRQALGGHAVRGYPVVHTDRRTGRERVYAVDAAPMHTGDGDPQAVVLLRDITLDHRHVERLEGFAGVVAHDLQNPVAAIRGWTETLTDDIDDLEIAHDAHIRHSLQRIEAGADRAHALINDLLRYSTARTATMRLSPIDLDALVDELVVDLREADRTRALVVDHGRLGAVSGDPTMVRQLFSNILDNAAKYTEHGVDPRVRVTSRPDRGRVEITMVDNGIGIPVDHRRAIFEPFHRAPTASAYSGTGLGLAICAQTVERHGGRITAEDNGREPGSRFVFTLPAVEPAAERSASPATAAAEGH